MHLQVRVDFSEILNLDEPEDRQQEKCAQLTEEKPPMGLAVDWEQAADAGDSRRNCL